MGVVSSQNQQKKTKDKNKQLKQRGQLITVTQQYGLGLIVSFLNEIHSFG